MDIIQVKNLKKSYSQGSEVKVLRSVTCSIKMGEFITVLGPSGCGKTTLMNIMGGLDRRYEGSVQVAGQVLESLSKKKLTEFRRDNVGFVFQQYHLLPMLTARENIIVGAALNDNNNMDILMKKMGIVDFENRYPYQLSGGQQQRIAIARAIAKGPKVLFCDEPTGALDEDTAQTVIELLVELNTEHGYTIVMITHNEAYRSISDRSFTLSKGKLTIMNNCRKENP